MRRFRKYCALLLCACLLAGCGAKRAEDGEVESLDLYASFYPVYAVAEMIADGVPDLQLHQLIQPQDGCLRAYELSDWDAALLASADGLLLCGSGLESFSETASALTGGKLAVVQLATGEERMTVEPVNADPEATPHWESENPHIYLSVDGAIELATSAAHSMAVLDPRYEDVYRKNLEDIRARLEALKEEIAAETAGLKGAKAAVLNEALVYAARDCGLDTIYWARESGEELDEGALEALLDAMREQDIRLALVERQAPQSLVGALEGAGVAVAKLDVLSTRRADEGSEAYFDALRDNAAAVRAAYENISREDS